MPKPVIKIENLGKKYIINHKTKANYFTLRDTITENIKKIASFKYKNKQHKNRENFWALRDVNVTINEGDRVGLIGRNGAGKSTLLKVLSRITPPSEGRFSIRGRVASLLEVGTGFHNELTGRENIFLNGAILGMSRKETVSKFDAIVDFAGVEKFLDTPVKRYSSGMYVRLAFAISAFIEPEILIVDEVLAVGDAAFQKQCLGKMSQCGQSGSTVIFVSHSMGKIKHLCNKGLLIDNGQLTFAGSCEEAVAKYLQSYEIEEDSDREYLPPTMLDQAYIYRSRLETITGKSINSFPVGNPWQVRIFFKVLETSILGISFGMYDKSGVVLRETWGKAKEYVPGEYEVILREDVLCLTPGLYPYYLAIDTNAGLQRLQYIENAGTLRIEDESNGIPIEIIDHKWGIIVNQMKTIFP